MSTTARSKKKAASASQDRQPAPIKPGGPHVRQPYPLRDLSHAQQFVAGVFADMLLYGPGRMADLNSVLTGLAHHYWKMRLRSDKDEDLSQVVDRWRLELLRSSTKAPAPLEERTLESKPGVSVTEYVRASLREVVAQQCEDFLRDAHPEELFILREILTTRDSSFTGSYIWDEHEVPLLGAFQLEASYHRTVKVPERHEDAVKNYLQLLLDAERGDTAHSEKRC